jgi:hypothetical protein
MGRNRNEKRPAVVCSASLKIVLSFLLASISLIVGLEKMNSNIYKRRQKLTCLQVETL